MNKRIHKLLNEAYADMHSIEEELKLYRNVGRLTIRKRNNGLFFSELYKNTERGITRNNSKLYKTSRKAYLEGKLKILKHNCATLEQAASKFLNYNLPSKLQYPELSSCIYSSEQIAWLNESFETNPFKPEQCKYVSSSGIKVRSKSERTIADKLSFHNILFRYECKLQLGNSILYPDFIILKNDGSIVIWEHFGLMDNAQYEFNSIKKIQLYNKYGYKQHTNLICTYEDDLENPEVLDMIIEKFLL